MIFLKIITFSSFNFSDSYGEQIELENILLEQTLISWQVLTSISFLKEAYSYLNDVLPIAQKLGLPIWYFLCLFFLFLHIIIFFPLWASHNCFIQNA